MSIKMNRINPNQTQVFYLDGRFETLTNEELEDLLMEIGVQEVHSVLEQDLTE